LEFILACPAGSPRLRLHGQMEHHVTTGTMCGFRGLDRVRQMRQNRKGKRIRQVKQLGHRVPILPQIVNDHSRAQKLWYFPQSPSTRHLVSTTNYDLQCPQAPWPGSTYNMGFKAFPRSSPLEGIGQQFKNRGHRQHFGDTPLLASS
jgi:hypothetical protein